MNKYLAAIRDMARAAIRDPGIFVHTANTLASACEARRFARSYLDANRAEGRAYEPAAGNPLWEYFLANTKGPGIWKVRHYFDIYHRHFSRFVGKETKLLEIGVYSGGSLKMWRSYLGERSHIYGMDVEPACRSYEDERITIFIGDQEDRATWKRVLAQTGGIDILIDDGGHTVGQQRVTLEETLPHLNPGGVYLCEDVHGHYNKFAEYAASLVHELNGVETPSPAFQSAVFSIHFYPHVVVIEKNAVPTNQLPQCTNGTEWQPFFNWLEGAPGKEREQAAKGEGR